MRWIHTFCDIQRMENKSLVVTGNGGWKTDMISSAAGATVFYTKIWIIAHANWRLLGFP